ncbi:MAG: hypothetical protein KC910_17045 [Candidatus Eremiobacteraeota bacterium]|nr:hypothetical protein [Candidatus Eremiobacteraeota bacterium]
MFSPSGGPPGKLPSEKDLLKRRRPPPPRQPKAPKPPAIPEKKANDKVHALSLQCSGKECPDDDAYLEGRAPPRPAEALDPDVRAEVRKLLASFSPYVLDFCRQAGVTVRVGPFEETGYNRAEKRVEVPESGFRIDQVLEAMARSFDHALGGDDYASRYALAVTSARTDPEGSNMDFFARACVRYYRDPAALKREHPGIFAYLQHLEARFAQPGP